MESRSSCNLGTIDLEQLLCRIGTGSFGTHSKGFDIRGLCVLPSILVFDIVPPATGVTAIIISDTLQSTLPSIVSPPDALVQQPPAFHDLVSRSNSLYLLNRSPRTLEEAEKGSSPPVGNLTGASPFW